MTADLLAVLAAREAELVRWQVFKVDTWAYRPHVWFALPSDTPPGVQGRCCKTWREAIDYAFAAARDQIEAMREGT